MIAGERLSLCAWPLFLFLPGLRVGGLAQLTFGCAEVNAELLLDFLRPHSSDQVKRSKEFCCKNLGLVLGEILLGDLGTGGGVCVGNMYPIMIDVVPEFMCHDNPCPRMPNTSCLVYRISNPNRMLFWYGLSHATRQL